MNVSQPVLTKNMRSSDGSRRSCPWGVESYITSTPARVLQSALLPLTHSPTQENAKTEAGVHHAASLLVHARRPIVEHKTKALDLFKASFTPDHHAQVFFDTTLPLCVILMEASPPDPNPLNNENQHGTTVTPLRDTTGVSQLSRPASHPPLMKDRRPSDTSLRTSSRFSGPCASRQGQRMVLDATVYLGGTCTVTQEARYTGHEQC